MGLLTHELALKFRLNTVQSSMTPNTMSVFYIPELMIPAKANVYYAINTQHDLNFILREDKSSLDRFGH